MGANVLGTKWIRKLQAITGKPIDRALVWSHSENGRWANARWLNEDGSCSHILVDRHTGLTKPADDTHWTTCPPRSRHSYE